MENKPNMMKPSGLQKFFPNRLLTIFSFLLILVAIVGVFIDNKLIILVAAFGPLLFLFVVFLMNNPDMALLIVITSYMFNLQFKYGTITSNTILILICLFSVVTKKIKTIYVDKAFLFWIVAYILFITFSYYFSHKLFNWYDVNLYINNLVLLLFMFFFDTEEKVERAFKTIVWCSLVLVIFGLHKILISGMPNGGMKGYFENHVVYALHIAWGIPFSLYFVKNKKNKTYLAILIILLCGVALAFSRGVLMALVLATLLTGIVISWKKFSVKGRMAIVAIFSMACLFIPIAQQNYKEVASIVGIKNIDVASSGRITLYKAAFNIFKEHPLVGIGWEKYRDIWPDYADILRPKHGSRHWFGARKIPPHSSYLKIIVELGLVGFSIYLIFNYCLFRSIGNVFLTKIGLPLLFILFMYYFHGFVDNNSYGNERMFYFVCGLLFSLKMQIVQTSEVLVDE